MCGPMVVCGNCGSNCCNGGTRGSYDPDHPCPDKCAGAYALQDAEGRQKWEEFQISPEYAEWEKTRTEWVESGGM